MMQLILLAFDPLFILVASGNVGQSVTTKRRIVPAHRHEEDGGIHLPASKS